MPKTVQENNPKLLDAGLFSQTPRNNFQSQKIFCIGHNFIPIPLLSFITQMFDHDDKTHYATGPLEFSCTYSVNCRGVVKELFGFVPLSATLSISGIQTLFQYYRMQSQISRD